MSRQNSSKKRRRVVVDIADTTDDGESSSSEESDVFSFKGNDNSDHESSSSEDLGSIPDTESDSSSDEESIVVPEDEVSPLIGTQEDTSQPYALLGSQQYSQPLKGSQDPSPKLKRKGTPRPKKNHTPDSLLTLTAASEESFDMQFGEPTPKKKNATPKKKKNTPKKPTVKNTASNKESKAINTEKKESSVQEKKKTAASRIIEIDDVEKPAAKSTVLKESKLAKPKSDVSSTDDSKVTGESQSRKAANPKSDVSSATVSKAIPESQDKKPETKSTTPKANKKSGATDSKPASTHAKPTSNSKSAATPKSQQKPVKRKRKVAKHHPTPGESAESAKKAPSTSSSKKKKDSETKSLREAAALTSASKPKEPGTSTIHESSKSKKDTETKPPKEAVGSSSNGRPKAASTEKGDLQTLDQRTAPPKKKKQKKRTFQEDVLHHMLFSCKPFSLKTLAHDLKTTDTALNHVMLSLLDKNLVFKKEFETKKTTKVLYWANQDSKAKEIMALVTNPQEMQDASREFESLRQKDAAIAKELNVVLQVASNDELAEQLQKAQEEVDTLKQKVKAVKDRINAPPKRPPQSLMKRGPPKSAAQLAREQCPRRTKMRINAMRQEWKTRKDKCMDFVDQLADGMEKKPKEVVKLLDIDTDESEGVTIPPKHVIDSK